MKPSHNNQSELLDAVSAAAGMADGAAARKPKKRRPTPLSAFAPRVPPSITAPANSIRLLRHGVDSLYLSFQGGIDPDLAICLQECKLKAQSINEHTLSLAGIGAEDHQFMVLPRGRGRFAFVLEDNWFSVQLSNASAGLMPLAIVQVRSEYLTAVGPAEAIATASRLLEGHGDVDRAAEDQPHRPVRGFLHGSRLGGAPR